MQSITFQYTSINYKYSSVVQIGEANITVIEAEFGSVNALQCLDWLFY